MSLNDLFDTPASGSQPAPRLTPRSPVSVKELIAIATLAALAWGAYDHLNKFADKTAVDQIATTQWQMRLEMQHSLDQLNSKVDGLVKAQTEAAATANPERRSHK